MAKDNAQRAKDKRAKQRARREAIGEVIVHLPLPAGTAAALDTLCLWFGFTDPREAIATMIHRVHEAGEDKAAPFFAVTRHNYKPSENVSRLLDELAAAMPVADDAGEYQRPLPLPAPGTRR